MCEKNKKLKNISLILCFESKMFLSVSIRKGAYKHGEK